MNYWQIFRVNTFLKKCSIIDIFCYASKILNNLGELSKILDDKYSLKEAATRKSSLKIAAHTITHILYYLISMLIEFFY